MIRYEDTDQENAVEIDAQGLYRTYTRGTRDPLYVGPDGESARKSLEMTPLDWQGLLLSDSVSD